LDNRIEIWTDGGCLGNPGPGGWAFVARSAGGTVERAGFERETTNNRMELTAVREALASLAGSAGAASQVVLTTDSQYVQKGITQWIHGWVRNGWKTSGKAPVKNKDLWEALYELSRGLTVEWKWVMGHAGNQMNERCHSLVEGAIARGA
jgi:ribonuclease HI